MISVEWSLSTTKLHMVRIFKPMRFPESSEEMECAPPFYMAYATLTFSLYLSIFLHGNHKLRFKEKETAAIKRMKKDAREETS